MAPLTLVTGSTGFIGSHVLSELVSKTDHRIRLVVRNVEKTDTIKENFGSELSSGRIEFVEVKDMLAPKAFHGKLEGVDYVVHLASPFVYHADNNRKDIIEPAVTLVNNVLEAADEVPSVKRIVVTSSFASIVNPLYPGQGVKRPHTYTEDDHQPITQAWLAQAYTPLAYVTSKTLAERAVWDHIEKTDKKPHYDAVTFHPPYVYGPVVHSVKSADKLNESSIPLYKLLDAKSVPKSDFPPFIDVRDVAAFHVAAITNPKASNQRYLISGGDLSWQAFVDHVHADPSFDDVKARIPVGTPGKKDLPIVLAKLDASKAEADFGWTQWRGPNECLADALRSLVELEKKWKA